MRDYDYEGENEDNWLYIGDGKVISANIDDKLTLLLKFVTRLIDYVKFSWQKVKYCRRDIWEVMEKCVA